MLVLLPDGISVGAINRSDVGLFLYAPLAGLFATLQSLRRDARQLCYVNSVDVPQRRIDDRLRALCAKLKVVPEHDFESVLQELLELVHQTNERLKRRAARLFLKGDHLEPERRASMQLPGSETKKESV